MPDTAPLVYGVWIENQGWLKDHGRLFSDLRREYAEEVLRFMVGTPAHIALIDDSMIALEQLFLTKEQERKKVSLFSKLRGYYHELLGSSRTNRRANA